METNNYLIPYEPNKSFGRLFSWLVILEILLISIGTIGCVGCNDGEKYNNIYRSSNVKEEGRMLDKIISIAEPDQNGHTYIEFQRSGHLWISTKEENYALQLSLLKEYLKDGEPVCVIPNEETHEAEVWSPDIDPVVGMKDHVEKGCIRVTLLKCPTIYELYKNHPRFAEIYNLLQQSMSSGQRAIVAVFPGGKRIEDVWIEEDTN